MRKFAIAALLGAGLLPEYLRAQEQVSAFLAPVQLLTTQESRPFVFASTILTPAHKNRWREYKGAIRRYPDARRCLERTQRNAEVVDLLQFDWAKPKDFPAIEVCLFRIFTTLGDPHLIEAWMHAHGFDTTPLIRYRSAQTVLNPNINLAVKSMGGVWTIDQYYGHRPSLVYSLTGWSMARVCGIQAQFSSTDRVVGADLWCDSKLN